MIAEGRRPYDEFVNSVDNSAVYDNIDIRKHAIDLSMSVFGMVHQTAPVDIENVGRGSEVSMEFVKASLADKPVDVYIVIT